MASITRILVPTDFSETADAALAYAKTIAERFNAELSLVHVFEDPFALSIYSPDRLVPMPVEMRTDILAHIHRQLAERLPVPGHTAATTDVLAGATAQAIVDDARKRRADLIVIGTHGRTGIAHALLGSVAERVVRTAPCPVLTVRGAAAVPGGKGAA